MSVFKKNPIKGHIIKTELSLVMYSALIEEVVNGVFIEQSYYSENLEPRFNIACLRGFTDIAPIMIKDKDGNETQFVDIEKTNEYCKTYSIVKYITKACNYGYIDELYARIVENIEFKKQQIIAQSSSVSDDLIYSIVNFVDYLKTVVESFNDKINATDLENINTFVKNANESGGIKDDFAKKTIETILSQSKQKDTKINKDNITKIENKKK